MNLLLLLSALLSALSGVGQGARPAQLAIAVAQTAEPDAPARRAVPTADARPKIDPPRLARDLSAPGWAIARVAPIYLSRRRE